MIDLVSFYQLVLDDEIMIRRTALNTLRTLRVTLPFINTSVTEPSLIHVLHNPSISSV